MSGKIPSLNPLHGESNVGTVTGNVFASLTRLNEDQIPVPYLAKSWEISEDGLSYTFHLEPDAKFHDGTPVTSEDVAFSLAMVMQYHRFGAKMFGPVTEVQTPDEKTAVFKLSEPHAPVLMSTTMSRFMPIMPKHVYGTQEDFMSNPAHKTPIGSGPFKITDVNLNEYVILDRFEDYFMEGRPYLDRIIMRIVTEPTAVRVGLQRGEFHLLPGSGIRYRDIKSLTKYPNVEVKKTESAVGGMGTIEFNTRSGPLSNKLVRQAIGHAIDTNFIAESLHDGWTVPGSGPFPSSNPFHNDALTGYEFNLEKANKLLDEAGYPRNDDDVRFELRLLYATNMFQDLFVTIPDYVVPSLKKVGIKVIREPVPGAAAWSKKMKDWDFEMSMALPGAYLDPGIGISRLYVCDNIRHIPYSNTSGFCDEKIDGLFKKAAVEANFDARKALYDEAQSLLSDAAPMMWVVELATPMIFNSNLGNPPLTGWTQYQPFDDIYLKEHPSQ
jgi:peptide/nickel transport system substrate-binding protein